MAPESNKFKPNTILRSIFRFIFKEPYKQYRKHIPYIKAHLMENDHHYYNLCFFFTESPFDALPESIITQCINIGIKATQLRDAYVKPKHDNNDNINYYGPSACVAMLYTKDVGNDTSKRSSCKQTQKKCGLSKITYAEGMGHEVTSKDTKEHSAMSHSTYSADVGNNTSKRVSCK